MPVEGTGLTILSSLFNDCAICVVIAEIATAAAAAAVTGGASAFPRWPSPPASSSSLSGSDWAMIFGAGSGGGGNK